MPRDVLNVGWVGSGRPQSLRTRPLRARPLRGRHRRCVPGRDRRSVIFGLLVSGLSVPARDDVDVVTALIGIPGSLIGMGIDYAVGSVRESREPGPA